MELGDFDPTTYDPESSTYDDYVEQVDEGRDPLATTLELDGVIYSSLARSEDCTRCFRENPRFRPLNFLPEEQ